MSYVWLFLGQCLGSFNFWRWSSRKVPKIWAWSFHHGLSSGGVWGVDGSCFGSVGPSKVRKKSKNRIFFFDFFWHFFGFFEGFFDFGLYPGWVNSANTPVTRGVAPLRQYSGHLMTFILGQNSYIFKKDTALCQKSRVRSHLWDPGLHWALQRPLFYPPVV